MRTLMRKCFGILRNFQKDLAGQGAQRCSETPKHTENDTTISRFMSLASSAHALACQAYIQHAFECANPWSHLNGVISSVDTSIENGEDLKEMLTEIYKYASFRIIHIIMT